MRTSLQLKTLTELRDECEARLTDSTNTLATEAQYLAGINEAVRMWGNRVTTPRLYTFSDGFTTSVYEYTLPWYINPPFDVRIQSTTYTFLGTPVSDGDDSHKTWHSVSGYSIEPDGSGGFKLRLPSSPYTEDAQILWYAPNGSYSAVSTTLQSTITSTSTSCATTDEDLILPPNGYLKIEDEWLCYNSLYNDTTGLLFDILTRGLNETIAASHNMSSTIHFGIGVDDPRLWVQLYDYVAYYVHALNMHKGTGEDIGRHEKLMSFYKQQADLFWRNTGYVPQKQGRRKQTPQSLGPMSW